MQKSANWRRSNNERHDWQKTHFPAEHWLDNYQFDSRVVILITLIAGSAEVVNAARHRPVVAGRGVVVSVRAWLPVALGKYLKMEILILFKNPKNKNIYSENYLKPRNLFVKLESMRKMAFGTTCLNRSNLINSTPKIFSEIEGLVFGLELYYLILLWNVLYSRHLNTGKVFEWLKNVSNL